MHIQNYIIIHTQSRQVRFYTLRRMALAFALIKQMLKLENRSKEACDFGRDLWIAYNFLYDIILCIAFYLLTHNGFIIS